MADEFVDDIEDCLPVVGQDPNHRPETLTSRTRAKNIERHGGDVPGDATVFVHTFGCGHNVSDGEYMAGQLAETGYRITDDFQNADCYLINSCTVKNPSEDHFVTMMRRAKATGKPVVVAGCVPQGDPKNPEWADISVIGVRHIDQVAEVVQDALRGNTTRLMSNETRESIPKLAMKKIRRNKYIEIIPINVGCLNFCTYCKTKHARGNLKSWPVEEIVARVKEVVVEGVREIRMTSEDTGAYGIDIGTNVVVLLQEIVKVLEGTDVMLRVGMSNPPYLLRQLEGFAKILLHPNVYEFIHIPVQSGSNAVLTAMRREYSVEEFYQCVDTFRRIVPKVSIATDIICAFPGEGEVEWRETMDLCSTIQFPVLNISRFYSRRGTPAASMPQVPTDISKRRSAELTKLYNSYTCYDDLIGTIHKVHLLEVAHDKHHLVGHTKGYAQVLVDPKEAALGDMVWVKVTSTSKYSVKATVIPKPDNAPATGAVPSLPAAAQDSARTSTQVGDSKGRTCRPTYPLLPYATVAAALVVGGLVFLRSRRS